MTRRIPFEKLEQSFDGTGHSLKQGDRQWCLEEAIDIVKDAARGGATELLEQVYAKLKDLGEDAWYPKAPKREKTEE